MSEPLSNADPQLRIPWLSLLTVFLAVLAPVSAYIANRIFGFVSGDALLITLAAYGLSFACGVMGYRREPYARVLVIISLGLSVMWLCVTPLLFIKLGTPCYCLPPHS